MGIAAGSLLSAYIRVETLKVRETNEGKDLGV